MIFLLMVMVAVTGQAHAVEPEDAAAVRAEFQALASRMRASSNPYVGTGQVAAMRDAAAAAEGRAAVERWALLAIELLRQDDVDGAEAAIGRAFDVLDAGGPGVERAAPVALRVRALVHLRRAEVENCIARHNADCCIFPLAGGGVHEEAGPAQRAMQDYAVFLERHAPTDLTARWLLNIAAMAAGAHPDGVPPRWRIDPSVFQSEGAVPRFTDVAPRAGVDTFSLCGGAIVDDMDGDGILDVVASTFDPAGPLTVHRGVGDGTFEDVSAAWEADAQRGGLHIVPADYDNDGDVDVLVLRGAWLFDDGRIRNSLLRNDGHRLVDVTRAAGLADPAMPTQAAAWLDYDNDGDLDLFIGNEARPDDPSGGDYPSQLFRNGGDGTFVDVAREAGVTNDRYAKGVAAGDFDDDGWIDLYVSNHGANRLYRNRGDGTFEDVAEASGVMGPARSFATWFFDMDNDGDLDLFAAAYEADVAAVAADALRLPHRAAAPALYRNEGGGRFTDVARKAGLGRAWLPMGAGFGDLDNDGWLDVYLATGDPFFETLMPNVMLRNVGGHRFEDVTTAGGFGHLQKGHGVVFADVDGDGDQDVYTQLGGFFRGDGFRNALFANPGGGGAQLTIRLAGTTSNRSGYGARVTVEAMRADGSPVRVHRAVGSVSSFGSAPRWLEVGLGDAVRVDRITIWWPASGIRQAIRGEIPLHGFIEVEEGSPGFSVIERRRTGLDG